MKMIIYGCGVACTILFVFFSLSKAPIKHNKLHEQNSESDLSQQRLSLPDDESLNRSDWVNDQDITQIWSEIRPLLLEKKNAHRRHRESLRGQRVSSILPHSRR